MNNIDKQYQLLLQDILDNGYTKKDRTGTGTISVYGRTIRHKMSDGFPLLTTKKMYFKGIVTELLWFLRGDTNIKYLVENGCHIWDGDAYKAFEKQCIPGTGKKMSKEEFIELIKTDSEFAKKWGNLGPIYGKQWRNWNGKPEQITNYSGGEINPYFCDCQERIEDGNSKVRKKNKGIDQIANSINLLKTDPDSRRNIVSAWNVGEIDSMVLPPCHMFFQFYTRELSEGERIKWMYSKGFDGDSRLSHEEIDSIGAFNTPKRAISLMWYQRSVDTPLGLPFNIASYALLLEIVGKMVNMVPDELIGTLGDTHIYQNQVDGVKEQLLREPYELPTLKIGKTDAFFNGLSDDLSLLTHMDTFDFTIHNYQSHPTIKYPLSN